LDGRAGVVQETGMFRTFISAAADQPFPKIVFKDDIRRAQALRTRGIH